MVLFILLFCLCAFVCLFDFVWPTVSGVVYLFLVFVFRLRYFCFVLVTNVL